jgi:hypothetical protein
MNKLKIKTRIQKYWMLHKKAFMVIFSSATMQIFRAIFLKSVTFQAISIFLNVTYKGCTETKKTFAFSWPSSDKQFSNTDRNDLYVSVEITNKIQPCNKIYYSKIYWRFNMFRAAYCSSSGVPNCICSLWFIYSCGDRPITAWVYKPEAANTVLSSWW